MKNGSYEPKSFEAVNQKIKTETGGTIADTSANIYESMLRSKSFKSLNPKQKILYVYCKAQYYGKRKPGKDFKDVKDLQGNDLFYFSWRMAQEYGLYKPSCNSNFQKDMKALIDAGLISKVSSGKSQHKKNIYQYSDRWKEV